MKKQSYLVLGLLVAVAFFAFSFASSDSSEPQDSDSYSHANISLQAKQLSGDIIDLDQYKNTVIIIDFWATWCPPCVAEIPHFISLQEKYGKDIVIIGISVDKDMDALARFIKEKKLNYPVGLFDPSMTDIFGEISGIPTTFVLDKNHSIVDKAVGLHSQAYFEGKIDPLLN
jgi:thiol-disulfide isomerase/thioredoxin